MRRRCPNFPKNSRVPSRLRANRPASPANSGRRRRKQNTAEDAGHKVSALEVKTAHLERDIERHEQEAAALLSSTSWRLSAPWRAYRRMVSRLRRLLRGKKINPLFDREWYLEQYPDVKESEFDPYDHYLQHGAAEGREPNALFDTDWYLDKIRMCEKAAQIRLLFLSPWSRGRPRSASAIFE